MALKATAQGAAEAAIAAIGHGYDVAADVRLKYCKGKLNDPNARLIDLGGDEVQDILLPGGLTVTGVPKSIKCDKGERMRFRSDVLSFQQVYSRRKQIALMLDNDCSIVMIVLSLVWHYTEPGMYFVDVRAVQPGIVFDRENPIRHVQ